ncbi:hypothetical protein [Mycobacterium haemophilum]|uniref:hypothetical protein n=1 Tax=Mycobacterium haemophilum TaxID=29311 RepID=UPI0021F2B69F|nr:hypothetical protein [Mycobacterium haemophilum]MCV7340431.1 hypothetical protein [Mycobacterium haemophilum DSM 44634]
MDVPSPWDLDVFISTTAQARGKPIRLIPHSGLSGPGQPCGVWIGRHTDDIIARGKPIRLIPHSGLSGPGQPCGVWIGRHTDDIIVYDDTTSGYHVEQIILHELGHLLLEHHCGPNSSDTASIQELVPDLDPATVTHVLNRTSYDTEQESQAELFASLIMSESRKAYTASKFLRTFLRD